MANRMSDRAFKKLAPCVAANCQNCNWQGHSEDLDPIKDVAERTEEGDTVWAGDCPKCGAMAFTVAEIARQQVESAAVQLIKTLAETTAGGFVDAATARRILGQL